MELFSAILLTIISTLIMRHKLYFIFITSLECILRSKDTLNLRVISGFLSCASPKMRRYKKLEPSAPHLGGRRPYRNLNKAARIIFEEQFILC